MQKAIWPLLTLLLMGVSFETGRRTGPLRTLPAMAATLPGAEKDFSREFDERLRQQFPIGTNEGALIAYLDSEGFAPDWPRRNEPYAAVFVRKGLLCVDTLRVVWRTESTGDLSQVDGAYASECM
jgi:hypothetical protein